MTTWFNPEAARSDPRLASVGQRFAARLIDTLGLGVVFLAALVLAGVDFGETGEGLSGAWTFGGILLGLLYEVPSTALVGQTLGKAAMRIRIVRAEDGGIPGFSRAGLRYLVPFLLGMLPIPLVALLATSIATLWFIWDPRRQSVPDKAARTLVVRVGQESPGMMQLS